MRYEIKNRWNGSVIYQDEAESFSALVQAAIKANTNLSWADLSGVNLFRADLSEANLSGVNLFRANLSGVNLFRADLSEANLSGVNLFRADLSEANLSGVNLFRANLSEANLSGAIGLKKQLVTPLLMLLDQPGKIRAYKLVTAESKGPFYPQEPYKIGKKYEVKDADTTENQCGIGINLATFDWCAKEWKEGYKILLAEFTAKDIASIPIATDGKFRVFRCKIVGEVSLKERGLIK